jgi:hypothetical protein
LFSSFFAPKLFRLLSGENIDEDIMRCARVGSGEARGDEDWDDVDRVDRKAP